MKKYIPLILIPVIILCVSQTDWPIKGGKGDTVKVDTISERTAANGVTIDSVTLKDGLALAGSGTVDGPAFSFSADTDTGMYNSGTNSLRLSTAGVFRVTIENDGAVVIADTGGNGGNVPHACRQVNNPVSTASGASASCAATEIVVGGGCVCSTASVGIRVTFPASATSWQCGTVNASNCGTLTAYAICCDY